MTTQISEMAPDAAIGDVGRPAALRRTGSISRDRLISRLLAAGDADCVTVVAPAGYGKTTMLAEWAEASGRETAWVTLDERHDDPGLLIATVVAAIDRVGHVDDGLLEPLASPQANLARVVVPRLCAGLSDGPPFSLVLDDVHEVRARRALDVIAGLASSLPLTTQLVLASREEPAIGIGRLRAKRAVLQIDAADMAMTSSEASRLFTAAGQPLERLLVADLVERTEGWPAALYLAALWLEREKRPERAIEFFTGDDRLVADYLREEFLARVDADTRDFLIRTSILDRLTGDLCDAVLEQDGSAARLRELSRSNLLLVPLDHRDREYRFHALLREMLKAELDRLGEGGERALHARASRWYAEHGDSDRAVDHAIASGDIAESGRLIWAALPSYSASGRYSTLVRWLGEFSEAQIRGSATLCVAQSIVCLIEGRGPEMANWATAAERVLASTAPADGPELEAIVRLIQSVSGIEPWLLEGADQLAEVRAILPPDDTWQSLCCCVEGGMRFLGGDPESAERVLKEGVRLGAIAAPSPFAVTLTQVALIRLDAGDVETAWENVSRALGAVTRFGFEEYQTSSFIFAVGALVAARRGDSESARQRLENAVDLQSQHQELSPWYEAETRIAIARTAILLDDLATAREHLAGAARCTEAMTGAVTLERWVEEVGEAIAAATSDVDRWPLTPAEIRLLHHLPTHRSFPEIAAHLYVSTNTVKTQAKSIYRKFNVSSRAEAVACARAAGLIGDGSPRPEDAPGDSRP